MGKKRLINLICLILAALFILSILAVPLIYILG